MPLDNLDPQERHASVDRPTFGESLVTAASFWAPVRPGVGSGWIEHAPFAFWLIEALRPRCFVELGSYKGYSYSAVCQAVQRLRTGTNCYAVDTWQGDDHAGFYGESVFDDLKTFNAQHFSSFSTLIRATFSEASRHFADASVDLLHIDGRHGYEDVKADYEEWECKLAPGAVVLFHDTNVHERDFGVFRFWREISRDRPHFEFLHGHGLGVLGSQQTTSPRLRALFAAAGDDALMAELRSVYARLGGALSDAYALESLRADAVAAQVAAHEQQDRLAELQRERDAFEAGCQERDAMVVAHQDRATTLARERAAFEAGCQERDTMVVAYQEQATALTREKAAFEDGCRERDAEIIRLRLQMVELARPPAHESGSEEAALVAALRDQIATHDREMARLMRRIEGGTPAT